MSSKRNFRSIWLVCLAALFWGHAVIAEPWKEGTPIGSVDVQCEDLTVKDAGSRFFKEAFGSEYSASKITRAIKSFYFRYPVYTIDVQGEWTQSSLALTVVIGIRPVIHDIEVRGNESLKDDEITSKISLQVGERAIQNQVDTVRDEVRQTYLLRGFPAAKVEVTLLRSEETAQEARLLIVVEESSPCTITEIEIHTDPTALSEEEIADVLRVSKGHRCDAEHIFKGTKKLEEEYRKRDYLAAKINDPVFAYNDSRSEARLQMTIEPGSKIDIRFQGNTFLFERNSVLKKAIAFDDERQFSSSWIEAGAKEGLITFYQDNGYPLAKITTSDRVDERHIRVIEFLIDRGPRVRIGKVEFEGAAQISQKELLREFWRLAPSKTADGIYVARELEEETDNFLAFYQSQGFLRAKISEATLQNRLEDQKVNLKFRVEEGQRSILSKYEITGNKAMSQHEIEEILDRKVGEPIDPLFYSRAAEKLQDAYRARGYKFVKVEIPSLDQIPAGEVTYPISLEEGPQIRIGEIAILGNEHTNDKVIRREIRFEGGDLYDPEKIRESRRRILQLGFFDRVNLEERNFNPETGTEDIRITVVERKKRLLAFGPGYSTDEGVRGTFRFGYLNIGGTGRNITATARVSYKLKTDALIEHQIVLTYQEPWLFNIVNGRINYIDERLDETTFNIERRSVVLGVDRDLTKIIRTSLQWELEYRNPFDVDPGAVLSPIDQSKARFGSIATLFDVDRRDDLLNPLHGSFHRLQFTVYDEALYSEEDFYQVFLRNTFYQPLYKQVRTVLALRVGFSGTYGPTGNKTEQIPIEKRFRLGGNSSLRGFNHNCVGGSQPGAAENCGDIASNQAPGGNSVFNYMLDFLFPIKLISGFDLALFTDGGNAYLTNADFNPVDIRTTAGAGIRYNTFFGPLRLDYGIKLDRREGESFGEIHFAVGQF